MVAIDEETSPIILVEVVDQPSQSQCVSQYGTVVGLGTHVQRESLEITSGQKILLLCFQPRHGQMMQGQNDLYVILISKIDGLFLAVIVKVVWFSYGRIAYVSRWKIDQSIALMHLQKKIHLRNGILQVSMENLPLQKGMKHGLNFEL